MPPKDNWSDRTKTIVWAVERLGIASAVCLAILLGLYGLGRTLISEIGVPLVRSHSTFLQSQFSAMEKIVQCQDRQQAFWDEVQETHSKQSTLIQQNQELLQSATVMMDGVPEERKKQTAILETIADHLKQREYP